MKDLFLTVGTEARWRELCTTGGGEKDARAILDDLRTDPAVEYITDGETGELLFPAV